MHENTKQRILEKKSSPDIRPEIKLPEKGRLYDNFKGAVTRLCEACLKSEILTSEEKNKIASLRSKIEIEF